jgi:hypothetical protein
MSARAPAIVPSIVSSNRPLAADPSPVLGRTRIGPRGVASAASTPDTGVCVAVTPTAVALGTPVSVAAGVAVGVAVRTTTAGIVVAVPVAVAVGVLVGLSAALKSIWSKSSPGAKVKLPTWRWTGVPAATAKEISEPLQATVVRAFRALPV